MQDLTQVTDEDQLEDLLSQPSEALVQIMSKLDGDFMLLGAGGKMGPSLARMTKRATEAAGVPKRVIAVSRFSSEATRQELQRADIETVACDLLDEQAVEQLPDARNVISMPGMKFGTRGDASTTWAINAYLPGVICRRFSESRLVAFSTGNVYPLVSPASGGSRETDSLSPVGEYAMSALGRERMLEYFASKFNIPTAIIRLNYACDLRYGVLVDLATQIRDKLPVDLSMGYFNTIWQGDANDMTLRAFELVETPPRALNVTGPECLAVRQVCLELAERLGVEPEFVGEEADTALLSNAQNCLSAFGQPRVATQQLIAGVANWVGKGKRVLGKPTHFATRDGQF